MPEHQPRVRHIAVIDKPLCLRPRRPGPNPALQKPFSEHFLIRNQFHREICVVPEIPPARLNLAGSVDLEYILSRILNCTVIVRPAAVLPGCNLPDPLLEKRPVKCLRRTLHPRHQNLLPVPDGRMRIQKRLIVVEPVNPDCCNWSPVLFL